MVVIEKGSHGIGLEVRGKLGNSRDFGQRIYSQFRYGEEVPIWGPSQYGYASFGEDSFGEASSRWGIYQIRTRFGKQTPVKEKYYSPSNPQTAPQQTNRQKLTDGVLAWQNLTEDQKDVYNERAKYKKFSGYNLFLKEHLLSH